MPNQRVQCPLLTKGGHLDLELSVEAGQMGCPRLPCRWGERCIEPAYNPRADRRGYRGDLAAATVDKSPKNIIAHGDK
jgi:hypothetical protein